MKIKVDGYTETQGKNVRSWNASNAEYRAKRKAQYLADKTAGKRKSKVQAKEINPQIIRFK